MCRKCNPYPGGVYTFYFNGARYLVACEVCQPEAFLIHIRCVVNIEHRAYIVRYMTKTRVQELAREEAEFFTQPGDRAIATSFNANAPRGYRISVRPVQFYTADSSSVPY